MVVDHLASVLEEAGDLLQPLRQGLIQESHFDTELGEILLGRSPARRNADEITLFTAIWGMPAESNHILMRAACT